METASRSTFHPGARMAVWCRLGLALSVLPLHGCATLVNGRHQEVQVVSEPPGADVRLNGQPVGVTPTTVTMRRRGDAVLEFSKSGYAPMTVPVGRRMSGWLAGNLVLLNPLAAQGMGSVGQWLASALSGFAVAVTTDELTGGGIARPRRVNATLTPLVR